MAEYYIPDPDDEFDTFQNQYCTYLNANLVALGLSALDPDVAVLNAQRTGWNTEYPASVAAQNAATSSVQTKDLRRQNFENAITTLTNRLQISGAVDDAEDYDFAGLISRTPHLEEFEPEQAGQMAHWVARWVNTRNQPGPWSDVVSAVVPG